MPLGLSKSPCGPDFDTDTMNERIHKARINVETSIEDHRKTILLVYDRLSKRYNAAIQ